MSLSLRDVGFYRHDWVSSLIRYGVLSLSYVHLVTLRLSLSLSRSLSFENRARVHRGPKLIREKENGDQVFLPWRIPYTLYLSICFIVQTWLLFCFLFSLRSLYSKQIRNSSTIK